MWVNVAGSGVFGIRNEQGEGIGPEGKRHYRKPRGE